MCGAKPSHRERGRKRRDRLSYYKWKKKKGGFFPYKTFREKVFFKGGKRASIYTQREGGSVAVDGPGAADG